MPLPGAVYGGASNTGKVRLLLGVGKCPCMQQMPLNGEISIQGLRMPSAVHLSLSQVVHWGFYDREGAVCGAALSVARGLVVCHG